MALLLGGHPDGLRQLLLDHGGRIAARLKRDFGKFLDDSEIDEAMGTMTVRIWQAASRFDSAKGTLRAWASVIARNCALRALEQRRRSRTISAVDLDALISLPRNHTRPPAERERLLADLHQCIAGLPKLQRTILQADLDAGDPVPAATLADRLATSANSIYVSRRKGRLSLLQALRSLGHNFGSKTGAAGSCGEAESP